MELIHRLGFRILADMSTTGISFIRFRALAFALIAMVLTVGACLATPLDDYVAKPDTNYAYYVEGKIAGEGYTAYHISMTSQQWRLDSEVDDTLWQHWITVIKPDEVSGNTGLLWITGGSSGQDAPEVDEGFAKIAVQRRTVVAIIKNVPHQPLLFADMSEPRTEDKIIAYTFDKYLNGGDAEWPLLLPMVKSVVRAMDTMTRHIAEVTSGKVAVDRFVLSGGSKRGWTTWLAAAVDPRVAAIAPAVIDVLKLDDQMRHHRAAYGFYSDAIAPYGEMNIFGRIETPKGKELSGIVDPYSYIDRLGMPKLVINGSGDQFFLPDSSRFYFHDLIGQKSLRYIPNADHKLNGSALDSLAAFYLSILESKPMPEFSWSISPGNGRIAVKTSTVPLEVKMWRADNPSARDFRLETIGPAWRSTPLLANEAGGYIASVDAPSKGWTAFFVELAFDAGHGMSHVLTTDVSVIPNRLPHAQAAAE